MKRMLILFIFLLPGLTLTATRLRAGNRGVVVEPRGKVLALELVKEVHPELLGEFRRAWELAGGGWYSQEAVVLLLRGSDGRYRVQPALYTREYRQVTLPLSADTVAVFHTHPNDSGAAPSKQDRALADQYGVPIFTLARRGMYAYNPFTRKTDQIMQNLNWLNPRRWTAATYVKLAHHLSGDREAVGESSGTGPTIHSAVFRRKDSAAGWTTHQEAGR